MANAAAPEQSCMMLIHRGVGDKTSTNPGELFASDLDKEELREITVLGPALLAGGKLAKLGENCQKIEWGRWLSHSCRAALCHPGWRAAGSCPGEGRLTPPALKKAFWKRLGAGCWAGSRARPAPSRSDAIGGAGAGPRGQIPGRVGDSATAKMSAGSPHAPGKAQLSLERQPGCGPGWNRAPCVCVCTESGPGGSHPAPSAAPAQSPACLGCPGPKRSPGGGQAAPGRPPRHLPAFPEMFPISPSPLGDSGDVYLGGQEGDPSLRGLRPCGLTAGPHHRGLGTQGQVSLGGGTHGEETSPTPCLTPFLLLSLRSASPEPPRRDERDGQPHPGRPRPLRLRHPSAALRAPRQAARCGPPCPTQHPGAPRLPPSLVPAAGLRPQKP